MSNSVQKHKMNKSPPLVKLQAHAFNGHLRKRMPDSYETDFILFSFHDGKRVLA